MSFVIVVIISINWIKKTSEYVKKKIYINYVVYLVVQFSLLHRLTSIHRTISKGLEKSSIIK